MRALRLFGRNLLISSLVLGGLIIFGFIAGIIISTLGPYCGLAVVAILFLAILTTIIDLTMG
jgi:hypothetical protein